MFESALATSSGGGSRRGFTTLTSFGLQAIAFGVLLLIPLLRPTILPTYHPLSTPISFGRASEPPTVEAHVSRGGGGVSAPSTHVFLTPRYIPHDIAPGTDDTPPAFADSGPYLPGAVPGGDARGVPGLFGSGTRPVMPIAAAPTAPAHPVRISSMSEGNLVRKVQPVYPPLARAARIQGTVVLQAVISKQGTITGLSVISGHPMLATAAVEAVRQWRYKPYVLNNEPVEVETQVTVNFSLEH